MSALVVAQIADAGDHEQERISFKAAAATDVGRFAIFRTVGRKDGLVSTAVRDVFWFPDKRIAADDIVVLYTKSGSMNSSLANGTNVHFFYWGKHEAMWAKGNGYDLVLVETANWKMFTGR